MFNKKDYNLFVGQLYGMELAMEKEAMELRGIITDPKIRKMLQVIIDDEKRHQNIVKAMKKLV